MAHTFFTFYSTRPVQIHHCKELIVCYFKNKPMQNTNVQLQPTRQLINPIILHWQWKRSRVQALQNLYSHVCYKIVFACFTYFLWITHQIRCRITWGRKRQNIIFGQVWGPFSGFLDEGPSCNKITGTVIIFLTVFEIKRSLTNVTRINAVV